MPAVLRQAFSNGALARAQAAFGAAFAAEWAFTVAIGLVAYADGGAAAVGLVSVLRLLPAGLLAPVIGAYADRLPRERVLIWSSALRAVATLLAAAFLASGMAPGFVYALAVVSTIGFTPFRAAHSALLPSLCRTTNELTASTVVRGALDSLSLAIGPFGAALLVSMFDLWTVFAFSGALALLAAALLTGLRYEHIEHPAAPGRPRIVAEALEGLRVIRTHPDVALVAALPTLQAAIRGALNVFVVVVAIDLLETADAGVGWLQGAMGVGAIIGSLAVTRLVGSHALTRWLAIGVAVWGAPLVVIGLVPAEIVALLALAVIGAGNAIVDVSVFSLPGRMVDDEVLARVFGVFESLFAVAVAAGALIAPAAISVLGTTGALIAVGLTGPLAALVAWPRATHVDRELAFRGESIERLRAVPILRVLPVPMIEHVARSLIRVELPAGARLFSAGEVGDRYYVVDQGRVRVLDGDRVVRLMGPGAGFGEIALLRDVPRTMTIEAEDDVVLQAIERGDFLAAITGLGSAREAAGAAMRRHLEEAPGALTEPVG